MSAAHRQTRPDNMVDKVFAEGIALTLEARNYIAFHEQADRKLLDLQGCLHVGYHHTRVSARLIQVMTWLLAMKAYLADEISREQFMSTQFSLTDSGECLNPAGPELASLPNGLRSLLDRSHQLYMRVQRLDNMARVRLEDNSGTNYTQPNLHLA
jgi:regulator of CtrA degradation